MVVQYCKYRNLQHICGPKYAVKCWFYIFNKQRNIWQQHALSRFICF
jgi:hypothetical protein